MTGNLRAERVRQCVRFALPGNATSNEIVAVISEGSDRTLELPVRETWEFPESSDGDAADRLRDGSDPIAQLEELRAKGARFLLVTDAASSWLAANSEFERHLDWNYRVVRREEETCAIFALHDQPSASNDLGPDGLPFPPPEMIHLVAGAYSLTDELYPRFYESGVRGTEWIRRILRKHGQEIEDCEAILDFGCGCGRITRHWKGLTGPRVHGTDYNPYLVEWCGQNLPFAEFQVNSLASELEYEDEMFDFIYAVSVFTHLDEHLQQAAIGELSRVLKPGGFLLLTVHGLSRLEGLPSDGRDKFEADQLVVLMAASSGTNDCATFHPERYIREELATGFSIVDFIPDVAEDVMQDAVLLQKPIPA